MEFLLLIPACVGLVVLCFYQLCVPWVAAACALLLDKTIRGELPLTPGLQVTTSLCLVICTWLAAELVCSPAQEFGASIDATTQLANNQVTGEPPQRWRYAKLYAMLLGAALPIPFPQLPVPLAITIAVLLLGKGMQERYLSVHAARKMPLAFQQKVAIAVLLRILPLIGALAWFTHGAKEPNSLVVMPLIAGVTVPALLFPPKAPQLEPRRDLLESFNLNQVVISTLVSLVTPGISASATAVQSYSCSSLRAYELLLPAAFVEGWNLRLLLNGGTSSKTAFAEVLKNYGSLVNVDARAGILLGVCLTATGLLVSNWLDRAPKPFLTRPPRSWLLSSVLAQSLAAVGFTSTLVFILAGVIALLLVRSSTSEIEDETRPMCFMIPIALGG
jgi:hypothetical protein